MGNRRAKGCVRRGGGEPQQIWLLLSVSHKAFLARQAHGLVWYKPISSLSPAVPPCFFRTAPPPPPTPPSSLQPLAAALKRRQSDPAAAFPPPAPPSSPADATLVLAPDECLLHFTAPEPLRSNSKPPPENVERLRVLTNPGVWAGGEGGGEAMGGVTRPGLCGVRCSGGA